MKRLVTILLSVLLFLFCSFFLFGCNANNVPKNIKLIMQVCGVTEEKAKNIESIFKECEIIELEDITHDEILDNMYNEGDKGYRITSEGIKNIILYLDKTQTVYVVRYANVDMYSGGTYKAKFSDFYLTTSQKASLKTSSMDYVRAILSSPTSADFPWLDWQYSKDATTKIATVSSYVDAKNGFGVKIRSYFTFMYKINNNSYSLLYFEFDNQIIVDYR